MKEIYTLYFVRNYLAKIVKVCYHLYLFLWETFFYNKLNEVNNKYESEIHIHTHYAEYR